MEESQAVQEAVIALEPYAAPLLTQQSLENYAETLVAGEPYIALIILLDGLDDDSDVPTETLANAINVLTDEDKDEFSHLLSLKMAKTS